MRKLTAWIALAALPLFVAGCGGKKDQTAENGEPVRLILDYLPNTLHVAFYSALDQGFYKDGDLDVSIMAPTSTTDTLRLMAVGKADFGLAPLIDIVKARADGEPVVILAGIVQTPLASIITTEDSGVTRPKDLEGRMFGTTGIPGDEIIVRSMMINDNGNPDTVKFINIGYNLVQNLAAGRIDAIIGFWSQEAILFRQSGGKPVVIRMKDYGFQDFPEIALFCREDYLKEHPDTVKAFLSATDKGMDWSLANEETALNGLAGHIEGTKAKDLTEFFDALRPVFKGDADAYGWMNIKGIETYSEWAVRMGLISDPGPVDAFITNEYLPTK